MTAMPMVIMLMLIFLFLIMYIFRQQQDFVCRNSVLQMWSSFSRKISSSYSIFSLTSSISLNRYCDSRYSSSSQRLMMDCLRLFSRLAWIYLMGLSSMLLMSAFIALKTYSPTTNLLLTLYLMTISFFQYSRVSVLMLVSRYSSIDLRNSEKMSMNSLVIRKSRIVLTMSWWRPMGSIMWQILFLKMGQTMLMPKRQKTLRSRISCRRGYLGRSRQMEMTMDGSPICVQQRTTEERLKRKPTPRTIRSSFFMEQDLWTKVCSQRQQMMILSHTNQCIVCLIPNPSSLLLLGSLKVQVLISIQVRKQSSSLQLVTKMGIILTITITNRNSTRLYSFLKNLKIQVLLREVSISCAQTSLRLRRRQMKQMQPSKAQNMVRQAYLKSPQFLVKQLQVYARGQMIRLMAMTMMASMHSTGDLSFMGQQSLKMNHYDPIRTERVIISRMKPTYRQTFVSTWLSAPRQYSHPQKKAEQSELMISIILKVVRDQEERRMTYSSISVILLEIRAFREEQS